MSSWEPCLEPCPTSLDHCAAEGCERGKVHRTAVLPAAGRWSVFCELCGTVGVVHELKADATAIALRHREVGGFG